MAVAGIDGGCLELISEADIPFAAGGTMRFQCYRYNDGSASPVDFVALVAGVVSGEAVHLRVHDACLTSEVFGSCKCDCKLQLVAAQRHISERAAQGGGGVIVYTFQEGRGIGLPNKIAAYHLQATQGLDTVEANLALGLPSENRRYDFVPPLLKRLNARSVVLLTNNPFKVSSLEALGVLICGRASVVVEGLSPPAAAYLATKVNRMGHLLAGSGGAAVVASAPTVHGSRVTALVDDTKQRAATHAAADAAAARPFVTLTFAQSLDGSIARADAAQDAALGPLLLSGSAAMAMTHALRGAHDAILVGVGTVLADDPRLTVRLASGRNPLPAVLDGRLRTPLGCRLVQQAAAQHRSRGGTHLVILAAATSASGLAFAALSALPGVAVEVCCSPYGDRSRVHLPSALRALRHTHGCQSVMVEGGARVIASFLAEPQLVDSLVVTVAPVFVGGLPAFPRSGDARRGRSIPALTGQGSFALGDDMVVYGRLAPNAHVEATAAFSNTRDRGEVPSRGYVALEVQSKL
jgi:3,4-dihydroxy 2-butanone 4-phosphate synthase/GTP cyclohydrolase II